MQDRNYYNEDNRDCALYNTEECRLLNAEGCLNCYVGNMRAGEQKRLKEALAHMLEEAPPDVIARLYTGDKCLLCKGDSRGAAECYAMIDLAKHDENGDWTFSIAKRRAKTQKGEADMLLPLQISCCKKCRNRYRAMEFLPYIAGILFSLAGLIAATSSNIRVPLHGIGAWAPFALFAAATVAGVVTGILLRRLFIASFLKKMELDAVAVKIIEELENNGWRELYPKKSGVSKFVFANSRRANGMYTSVPKQGDKTERRDDASLDAAAPGEDNA